MGGDVIIELPVIRQGKPVSIGTCNEFRSAITPMDQYAIAVSLYTGCLGIGGNSHLNGQVARLLNGDFTRAIVRGRCCRQADPKQEQDCDDPVDAHTNAKDRDFVA